MIPQILVVDGNGSARSQISLSLDPEQYQVAPVESVDEAQKRLLGQSYAYSAVIVELSLNGKDGFQLLKWVQANCPDIPVIAMSDGSDSNLVLKAFREGACEYLTKPLSSIDINRAIRLAFSKASLNRSQTEKIRALEERCQLSESHGSDRFRYVSRSPSMNKVNEWLTYLQRESMKGDTEEAPVLFQGERGTGKRCLARLVHGSSRRGKGPWGELNCAEIPASLIESELMGCEPGTQSVYLQGKRGLFEICEGGTVYLENIHKLSSEAQKSLTKALQTGKFRRVGGTTDLSLRVRFIGSTHLDLQSYSQEGKFRSDLCQLICKNVVSVPSLKERKDEIVSMAKHFAETLHVEQGSTFPGFTDSAEKALQNYSWPGNLRELLDVLDRAMMSTLGDSQPIHADYLHLNSGGSVGSVKEGSSQSGSRFSGATSGSSGAVTSIAADRGYMAMKKQWSEHFEKEYLIAALVRNSGNVSAAAREAKLDRSNFLRMLRRHGIKAQAYRNGHDLVAQQKGEIAEISRKVA